MSCLWHRCLVLLLIIFANFDVKSQCCSGGVPISGSIGLSSEDTVKSSFLLTYDYNRLSNLYSGNRSLNDNHRIRVTSSILFEAHQHLFKRLSIGAVFTNVWQSREINQPNLNSDFVQTQGIGDGIVLLKYKIIKSGWDQFWHLEFGAGPKIPLGKTNQKDNRGLSLPADLQPGSGAWDFIFYAYAKKNRWIFNQSSISFRQVIRLTGTNPKYFNTQTYAFGDEINFSVQWNYQSIIAKNIFYWGLTGSFRHQRDDLINGLKFPNSGGSFAFLSPNLSWEVNRNLSILTSGALPIYRNVNGTQLTTQIKWNASIYLKI